MKSSNTTLHKLLLCLVLASMLLSACAQEPQTQNGGPRLALNDCQLSANGMVDSIPAQCGTLTVYEDRAAGAGRQIDLKVAVVPAVSRNAEPDPLFFLAGGPGQAATETYPLLSTAFERIHQKRDIVLVDQRGTGSSHPLTCEMSEEEAENFEEEDLLPFLQKCAAELDADPRFYTTTIAMQDLDEVRAALGYDQINLYGVSYGSRAAQTYMKMFPDRLRTVILDGVVPQSQDLGVNIARDAQGALDKIFDRCEADPQCTASFPNVRADFDEILADLQANPVDITIPNPFSGEPLEITFNAQAFATAQRFLSYSPETVALIPLILHNTAEKGDYNLLAAQYVMVAGQLGGSMSTGMGYSVLCAEDAAFLTPEEAEQANVDTYLGSSQTDSMADVCSVWPTGTAPQGFKDPVVSDIPTLLLSGEFDPVTPPENAEAVAANLSNSLHVVAPGMGHNVIYLGCIPRLAADFVEFATTSLDASCVQQIEPMPFFVNFTGPLPEEKGSSK